MSIEVSHLTKKYQDTTAVDDVTFSVPRGSITGFLGPNGAGKSTTMRMITGLDAPTSGTVSIGGKNYTDLNSPWKTVGSLLDARTYHPKRSAYNSLAVLADASGIPLTRVDELLEMVGLATVKNKKVGGFSLGMHQRLGIAATLLGDPDYVILDEPANGLDPEGIRWVRDFMVQLAGEGKTVFISSHQLREIQEIATHLVIIAAGKIQFANTMDEFKNKFGGGFVVLTTENADNAIKQLRHQGITELTKVSPDTVHISNSSVKKVGEIAAAAGIPVYGLSNNTTSLEDAFLEMTRTNAQYSAQPGR